MSQLKQEVEALTGIKNEVNIEHLDSGNSSLLNHKPEADWDSRYNNPNSLTQDLNIPEVSEDEISDCLPDLRFLLQVFEGNSWKFLFKEKYLISSDDAIQAFKEKLKLSSDDANKLALYLVVFHGKGNKTPGKIVTLNVRDFQGRIEELVGKYRQYDKDENQALIDSFFSTENSNNKIRFLNEMTDLAHVGKITKNEFEKTLGNIPFDINLKSLMISLLRDSNSLHIISGDSIKSFVDIVKREEKHYLK